MKPWVNSLYSITYALIILGAIMMGMGALYNISFPAPETPLLFNLIGLIIFISAITQVVLFLQGYKVEHVE